MLVAWEEKRISTFWDNQGLGEGTYDVEITLFYEGQTTKLDGKIEIIVPEEDKSFFEKYLNFTSFGKYLTTTNLLIALVLLLIIINIYILSRKRKSSKK